MSNTSGGCGGGICWGTTPDNAIFTIDPTQLPVGQGVATGYVVVDGGSRGMDYLIVAMPALPASASVNVLAALIRAVPPRTTALSYVDAGNGSLTSIRLVNIGSLQATYTLRFWTTDPNTGTVIPLAVPLSDGTNPILLTGSVLPGGMKVIDSSATALPEAFGWAELVTTGNLQGYAVLNQSGPTQVSFASPSVESAMPLSLSNRRFTLPYDNTNNGITQVFLANPGATTVTITLNLVDSTGTQVPGAQQTFQLGSGNQTWFVVSDLYPQTIGNVGVMTLSAGAVLSASAIRFDAAGGMSYSPAFSIPPTGGDSVLPIMPYGGGWTSTLVGINSSTGISDRFSWFFSQPGNSNSDKGVALDAGVVGNPGNSYVNQNISIGGIGALQTSDPSSTSVGWVSAGHAPGGQGGLPLTNAYGLFDLTGWVSNFSTYLPMAAPFQDRGLFPFDNTGGFNTLLFLGDAETTGLAQFTLQVRDEGGNSAPAGVQLLDANNNSLNLPWTFNMTAHGRIAFQLNGGARGTIQVTGVGHPIYGQAFRLLPGSMFTTLPAFQGPTGQ